MAQAPSGPICHQVQQQASTVCLSGPRPPSIGSGCPQLVIGRIGPIRLPTGGHLGQSGGEAVRLPLQQDNTDCTRVAKHALVLGSGSHVQSDSPVPAQPSQSGNSTIQPDPTQKSVKSQPPCVAPRASAIKEQGFSEAVAARIEAPQRRSTYWPWVQVNAGVRSMLGYTKISDTKQTGPKCLYTPLPAFYPRISWPKRDQIVWPR